MMILMTLGLVESFAFIVEPSGREREIVEVIRQNRTMAAAARIPPIAEEPSMEDMVRMRDKAVSKVPSSFTIFLSFSVYLCLFSFLCEREREGVCVCM
jgi:hypothetical protein